MSDEDPHSRKLDSGDNEGDTILDRDQEVSIKKAAPHPFVKRYSYLTILSLSFIALVFLLSLLVNVFSTDAYQS